MIHVAISVTTKEMTPHIHARIYDSTLETYFPIDFYSYEEDLDPAVLAPFNDSTLWFSSEANYEDLKKTYKELGYLDGRNYSLSGKNCADAVRDVLNHCGFNLPKISSGWTSICYGLPFFACCCSTPDAIYSVLTATNESSNGDIHVEKLKNQPPFPKSSVVDPEITYISPAAEKSPADALAYRSF